MHFVIMIAVGLLIKAIKNREKSAALFAVAAIVYALVFWILHLPHFLEYIPLFRNLESVVFFILLGLIAGIEKRKESF